MNTQNKKVLLSLMVLGLVALLISISSFAYFSDTEDSTSNSFSAGTLNLTLTDLSDDGSESETLTWVYTNLKPTDSGGATLTVENNGTVAGTLDLSSISIIDAEGTNPESETAGGNGLSDLLTVHVFFDVDGDGTYDVGTDTDIYGTSASFAQFSAMAASYDSDYALAASGTVYLTLNYNWPSSANDNDAQGDITTFTFTVELDQIAD